MKGKKTSSVISVYVCVQSSDFKFSFCEFFQHMKSPSSARRKHNPNSLDYNKCISICSYGDQDWSLNPSGLHEFVKKPFTKYIGVTLVKQVIRSWYLSSHETSVKVTSYTQKKIIPPLGRFSQNRSLPTGYFWGGGGGGGEFSCRPTPHLKVFYTIELQRNPYLNVCLQSFSGSSVCLLSIRKTTRKKTVLLRQLKLSHLKHTHSEPTYQYSIL